MEKNIKVLIVGPDLQLYGGVSYLFNTLFKTGVWKNVEYMAYGGHNNIIFDLKDLFVFLSRVYKYDVIHLNPSFDRKSIFRESLYLLIAKIFRKKVIFEWMGWTDKFEEEISSSYFLSKFIENILSVVDTHIVLSDFFTKKLEKLNIQNNIETIFIPYDIAIDDFEFKARVQKEKLNILFLARIEHAKGIKKLIDIFELLDSEKYTFTIAGDGDDLEWLKEYAKIKNLNINFTGYIKGKEKVALLQENDIFLFPSEHPEGFPLIIAEAMRAGLILVSSDAGAIGEMLSSKNGFIIAKEQTAQYFSSKINDISNVNINTISNYNIKFSLQYFYPDNIANKYFNVYK